MVCTHTMMWWILLLDRCSTSLKKQHVCGKAGSPPPSTPYHSWFGGRVEGSTWRKLRPSVWHNCLHGGTLTYTQVYIKKAASTDWPTRIKMKKIHLLYFSYYFPLVCVWILARVSHYCITIPARFIPLQLVTLHLSVRTPLPSLGPHTRNTDDWEYSLLRSMNIFLQPAGILVWVTAVLSSESATLAGNPRGWGMKVREMEG